MQCWWTAQNISGLWNISIFVWTLTSKSASYDYIFLRSKARGKSSRFPVKLYISLVVWHTCKCSLIQTKLSLCIGITCQTWNPVVFPLIAGIPLRTALTIANQKVGWWIVERLGFCYCLKFIQFLTGSSQFISVCVRPAMTQTIIFKNFKSFFFFMWPFIHTQTSI